MDPGTAALIGSGTQAATGIFGSLLSADAVKDAAKKQADAARRNAMMGIQANEPLRSTGYQALNDINSVFGYTSAPYASGNQLAAQLNPLTAKQVKQAVRNGYSFEQIQQMGTLGLGNNAGKYIKRLIKAGLTPEQIQQLQQGPQAQSAPQPAQGPTGMAAFQASPDYQWRVGEGQKGIANSFAARGGASSGNALKALSEFNQNMAGGEFQNWFNRRLSLVNGGQGATNATTGAGNTFTNSLMQSQQQQGDARASGILGVGNSIGNAVGDWAYGYGQRNGQTGGQTGTGPYAGGYQFPGTPPYVPPQKPFNTLDYLRGI